jgi:hypothetical protein
MMKDRFKQSQQFRSGAEDALDPEIDALLHPAHCFDHPHQVVHDPDLTLNEKRAILASWASDACAVEAAPALRRVPGSGRVVSVDGILEALRALDRQAGETGSSWVRRQVRRASIELFRESRNRRDPRNFQEDDDRIQFQRGPARPALN